MLVARKKPRKKAAAEAVKKPVKKAKKKSRSAGRLVGPRSAGPRSAGLAGVPRGARRPRSVAGTRLTHTANRRGAAR